MKRVKLIIICILTISLTGCLNFSKPSYTVEYYLLEYPSPIIKGFNTIDTSLKIERFSTNRVYNTQAMVYRAEPFKYASYHYSHWRVVPADMVSDLLFRDIKGSGAFRAVYSYNNYEQSRFHIQGTIEEFLEIMDKGNHETTLSLTITLLDTAKKAQTERVLLQKTYSFKEKITEHSPLEFSKGMSLNMCNLSKVLTHDIYEVIKHRIER